jgi:hypothetical protein
MDKAVFVVEASMARAVRIPETFHGAPARLFALGCLALGVGVLVYLTDRDPSRAALVPAIAALSQSHLFGAVGLSLPSFVHPFAFSLFTAALQPARRAPAYWACGLWWAINVAFEIGQAPSVSAVVADLLPRALEPTWLAAALSDYLLQGTCTVADLVAVTAGAAAAAAVLRFIHFREARDAH